MKLSKLFSKLIPQVRQLAQRGGDRLPAKREPTALGLHAEDMTDTLAWCMLFAKSDPASAWDLYKRQLRHPGVVVKNRMGDIPPIRVSIEPHGELQR